MSGGAFRKQAQWIVCNRSLKTALDQSLFASVGNNRFDQLRICVWVYLYDPEIVLVGLGGDLLDAVRLAGPFIMSSQGKVQ